MRQNVLARRVMLEDVRLLPIPTVEAAKTALDYHAIKISVRGQANREPLVNVRDYGVAANSAYARVIAPYYRAFPAALAEVWVRRSVAEKLAAVDELLAPYNAELVCLDGYRSIQLQWDLWNHFIAKGREALTNPTEDDLVNFAGIYCSDPRQFKQDDFRTWPVHNTGGAIDLTLRSTLTGQELFMGSIFDDADAVSQTRFFENATLISQSADEARRNRRLLFHAMQAVGFANYSNEFWHFDYGTQMWVMNGCHKCNAVFGRVDAPAPAIG
jgi:D-alanyl-D-alanine dipeptidase